MSDEPTGRDDDRGSAIRLLLAGLILASIVAFGWWRFVRPHQADVPRPSPPTTGPAAPTPLPVATGAPNDVSSADGPALLWRGTVSERTLASPAVGDLDGDRLPEVVVCGEDGDLRALSGRDGTVLWTFETTSEAMLQPAIADLDGDLNPEVLFGTRDGRVFANHGHDGEHFWTHNVHNEVFQVAAADLDADGAADAVFAHEGGVKALTGRTAEQIALTEYPRKGRVSIALWDLDSDGVADWVANYSEAECHTRAVSGRGGSMLWMRQTGESALSLPAFGDVDGDGKTDCVFTIEGEGLVLAVAGATGSEIRRWTAPQVGRWRPSLADVDGDGALDVLVASAGAPGWVAALAGTEDRVLWRSPAGKESSFAPVVFLADGDFECAVADGATGLAIRSARDGSLVTRFELGSMPRQPPVVADLDEDGRPEIVVVVAGDVLAFRVPRGRR